jgi:geranylgeranyl diphosphate synthase type II
MQSFTELQAQFEQFFAQHHFPAEPSTLYEPCSYLLHMGGKRVRPVLCLMSQELFAPINDDSWNTATAIELFHNFTLMHDDIMDAAPMRRGKETVHVKYDTSTAILSGDVMNIFAYVHLNKINSSYIHDVISLFNKTAIQICEGQQLDMDYEKRTSVSLEEYMHMITLKTSVLLGASVKLGAMLGGATEGCSDVLYSFGKCLGLAFQLRDDYLDLFGESSKTGKQLGGDVMSNKKTFLMAKAFELCDDAGRKELMDLLHRNDPEKVQDMKELLSRWQIQEHLLDSIRHFSDQAFYFLEKAPVLSKRKMALQELATQLLNREH